MLNKDSNSSCAADNASHKQIRTGVCLCLFVCVA